MELVCIALLTCLFQLVPVFSSPAMAPRSSNHLSLTFHRSMSSPGVSIVSELIQDTAASDTSRLQLVNHNSAPCLFHSSARGDRVVTANLSPASVTPKAIKSLIHATKSAVAGPASSGYFAAARLTRTGSISGTGRLSAPGGESAPFSLCNTSPGITAVSAASDQALLPSHLQTTRAVTAPTFNFGTGTNLSSPITKPGNNISDGSATKNTSTTFTRTSNSAKAMPSPSSRDFDEDRSDGDATVSLTTTSNYPLAESSEASSPSPSIWNSHNTNCRDFSFAQNGSQQWALVDGDAVVSTFESMFASNALICPDCWGGDNNTCTSSDWRCRSGLKDVSQPNASSPARWDTAAAHFAGLGSETDLTCGIMQTECSGAPDCTSCNGPGPWAIIKSLETMQNLMENIYNAIIQAGVACDTQMTLFSKVFAPVPSIKDETLMLTLFADIFGSILGFIIPIVGQIAGVAAGVASAVMLSNTFAHAPGPVDTATVLGLIANQTASAYSNFAADLFADGSASISSEDGKVNKTISLRDQMKDGALMQQQPDPNGYYTALIPVYQRILFQQLALFTWQNLEPQGNQFEVDGSQHMAFITFDNNPCDQFDHKTPGTLLNKWGNLIKDANTTYDGRCYYLLDAFVATENYDADICTKMSFPGGTNKALTANAEQFATLSLADFILPAVRGWQANGNLNGYPTAASNGVLPTDPQAAASVSIPICDYANNEKDPGADCPKLGHKVEGTGCDTYNGANPPGSYNPGECRVHVTQYNPNSRNDPLNYYEMAITVFDNSNIEVGQATKESAENALVIVDSALPFQLIVATGADKDTITFWYADQYWDSKTGCGQMGGYDRGSRQGDCSFKCPFPASGDPPPVSATIAHPLPGPTIAAIAGSITYLNTFITAVPATAPTAAPAPPTITYAKGKCKMHIKQYQKHDGENETGDYQIDAVIYDAKKKALQDSGTIPAPGGTPVEVYGLVDTVTLTAGNVDDDPFTVSYQGDTWKTNDKGKCKVGKYKKGTRSLDCPLIC